MPIPTYFAQIEQILQRYAKTSFVIDSNIEFAQRIGNQSFLKGSIEFLDHSVLYFKEYVDIYQSSVDTLMYSYHYQDSKHQMIFRYDNSLHKPALSYHEHKHLKDRIVEAPAPTLAEVLAEIFSHHGWV